jgi:O-antigen/teichoic acid export membrane protein
VSQPPDAAETWLQQKDSHLVTIARNVSTRYLAIAVELLVGVVMLPFNLRHLGQDAYGLWMLVGSVTIHFSVLDMGYGSAIVKFVAQYRAHKDARALNEIASTMFFMFAAIGIAAYLVVIGLAFNLDHVFRITPDQAHVAKWLLLIIGLNVACNFPFSVYGGVIDGFQRYDRNNVVAIGSAACVALANAAVLKAGYGLIPLVAATTSVRILTYFVYRANAFRVYPPLRISASHLRRARLREITGFSIYSSIIDWANKLNYELDEIVIGAFLGSAPVAIWAVADRIISGVQRLTNQVNGVLFPFVVDSDTTNKNERLRRLLLEGTRLSLATVVPIAMALIILAHPLVRAWVGQKMSASAPLIQILAIVVAMRVGNATGTTLLKGAGRVRYLAVANIATGIVNLLMSALLVRSFGLAGVAFGTLVPVAFSTMFVLFPAACRRVELPVSDAIRFSVWPAVWPAIVAGIGLQAWRLVSPWGGATLMAVSCEAAAASIVYFGLFALAIGRRDRSEYVSKVLVLLGRWPGLAPAA